MRIRRGLKPILAAALALVFALSFAPAALAEDGDYSHRYVALGEGGYSVGDSYTTLFQLEDGAGGINYAYCVDMDTYIVDNSMYARSNLDGTEYFDEAAAARIRAIVRQAYPFMPLADIAAASGIESLTVKEAITAAQLTIWQMANDAQFTCDIENVNRLCAYYAALPPIGRAEIPIASIQIERSVTGSAEAGYTAEFRYRTQGTNVDGSPIALTHDFDRDIEAEYQASVSSSTADGWTKVVAAGLPADAIFNFRVRGTQRISFDTYLYLPQGGRSASQSLVGAFEGSTSLAAQSAFQLEDPEDYCVRVYKYDSRTTEGIEGAVFQLSNNESFSDPIVYECATDAEGYAEFRGLSAGKWYLRESSAPVGYVPDREVYVYDIDEVPIDLVRFKNTHYGQIQILKADDSGKPVAGATFNIYRGESQEAGQLVKEGLVTDENGLILAGDLVPGTYTVVETAPPLGYHMAENPSATVTVEPHETATVNMVNPLVKRGKIGVAKEDYESGKRLPGAKIAIYSDEACTELLWEVETVADGDSFQYLEELLPGVYYVKELVAPEGYILNPRQSVVQMELAEGEVEEVVFRNRPRIDTAGNYGLLLLIGAALVLLSGSLVFVLRKRLFKR